MNITEDVEVSTKISINKTKQSKLQDLDFDNLGFGINFTDHMFVAHFENGAWRDLQIKPFQNLSLSPAVMGLHYGQSIFEGLKAYYRQSGEVVLFRPRDNARRLNVSAGRMCMPTLPEEIFLEGLSELVRTDKAWVPKNEGETLYIRPLMFATDEYVGLRPSDTYSFIIFASPVGMYYSEPVKVKIETHFVRAVEGGTGFAKTAGNYARSLYPAKLAQDNGYHQLIWTDAKERKYIEEAGTMNVMFRIKDTIITAQLGDTILNSITRRSILKIAEDFGLRVEQRKVSIAEIIEAIENNTLKEAFGVGTAATVSPISLIAYDGVDYEIPKTTTDSFGEQAKKYLIDLQRGRIEDKYNWIYSI